MLIVKSDRPLKMTIAYPFVNLAGYYHSGNTILTNAMDFTEEAMRNPVVGDRFHEMLTHWYYICAVAPDGCITTVEGTGNGIGFPKEAKVRQYKDVATFQEKFKFITMPGYFIQFYDRGNNVEGWIERVQGEQR